MAYEDYISIPKFYGINQASDEHNTDLKYANDGKNFNTEFGGFKPYMNIYEGNSFAGDTSQGDFLNGITLATMVKRWAKIDNVLVHAERENHTFAIAATWSGLFYCQSESWTYGGDSDYLMHGRWHEILDPDTGEQFRFRNANFSTLTYEMNYYPPEPLTDEIRSAISDGAEYYAFNVEDYDYFKVVVDGARAYYVRKDGTTEVEISNGDSVRLASSEAPIDCLLLSSDADGMLCVYLPLEEEYDEEDYRYVSPVKVVRVHVDPEHTGTDIRFGTIARYCERIIGAGIPTDPDKLMYSAPFDLFNWEQNNEIPEDGAGDIQQPNWDGDGFISLEVMGNSLLCIKKHGIWKITGTDPSQFVFKRQYGEGAVVEGSTQVNGYYTYMLSEHSIKVFDGSNCYDLMHGSLRIGYTYLDPVIRTSSAMCDGKYYLLVGDELIIFNTNENTYNKCDAYEVIRSGPEDSATKEIQALCVQDGVLYALVSSELDEDEYVGSGNKKITLVKMFAGGTALPVEWESAWIDLNARNINKSNFSIYIMLDPPECAGTTRLPESISCDVTIETEKKAKTKTVALKWRKQKRIQVNNQGRMFKLKLKFPALHIDDVEAGAVTPWRIATGIQIYLEYDYD